MIVTILCWIVSAASLLPAMAGVGWLLLGRGGGKRLDHLITIAILAIIGSLCLVEAIRRTL